MEITTISRTISGFNFDNISATSPIKAGENPIEVAKQLDAELRKMLSAIRDQEQIVPKMEREKEDTVSLLQRALDFAKNTDIPF